MQRGIGAKILILTLVLSIPIGMVMSIRLTLDFISHPNWLLIIISLPLFLILLWTGIGLLTVLSVRAFRNPEAMEKLYKQSGSVVVFSFLFYFPIVADFIVYGRLFYEDAISTAVVFFLGTLVIISGFVMLNESKIETKRVGHEECD